MKTDMMKTYLWQIAGNDPRYQSFLAAQNITRQTMTQQSLYDTLMKWHGNRIDRYLYYWDLFFGRHWVSVANEETETDMTTVNYCQSTVRKNIAFLMNKGFLVESMFPEIEKFLQLNWRLNNGGSREHNSLGQNLALQGSVAGDAWVEFLIATEQLTGGEYIKYNLLPSHKCFPVISRREMLGFLYYGKEQFVKNEQYGFSEYDSQFEGWYYTPGQRQRIVEHQRFGEPTPNSYSSIPVVHFRNFPIPIDTYGMSDLVSLVDLNLQYDKVASDVQDIIDFHASPVTVLKGAKVGDLIRGVNRVWSIPKDASIDNLTLDTDLGAIKDHLARIREAIAEMSNVPEATIGKLQNISNTSGAALAITFMPLYEVMELKRIQYGMGILELNTHTLQFAYMMGLLSPTAIIRSAIERWNIEFAGFEERVKEQHYPFSKRIPDELLGSGFYDRVSTIEGKKLPRELYESFITWYPPLPRDEKADADLVLALTSDANPIYSRRHGRSILGMSERESLLMEKEIERQPKFEEPTTITNVQKTGLEGNPDVKGEKESRRVENEQ